MVLIKSDRTFTRQGIFQGLLLLLSLTLCGCFGANDEVSLESLNDGELMVSGLTPDSGELTLLQTMGLRFAGAEIPVDSLLVNPLEHPPGTIQPEVKGSWQLVSSNYIQFIPDESYEPNTTYKLKLDPDYFKKAQITLRGLGEFEFQAAPFRCENISMRRIRLGGVPSLHQISGRAHFNYPVDPEKFAEALQFSWEDGQPVGFITETTATSKTINFRTEEIESGRRDRLLILTLNGKLNPLDGDVSLGEDLSRTENIPAIERLKIENVKVTSDAEQPVVKIQFSHRTMPEDLKPVLKIEPEVEGLRMVAHWGTIDLVGAWQFDENYKIDIDSSLMSEAGLPLEKSFTRTVKITDLDPMLRITGPGNYLSLHGDGKVGIETINLGKFNVSVERIFANNLVPFLQRIQLTNHEDYY